MKKILIVGIGLSAALLAGPALAMTGEADIASVIGIAAAWNTLPLVGQIGAAFVLLSHAASWVTALTPTPKDDPNAGKVARYASAAYKIIEMAALVTGKAKQRDHRSSVDEIERDLRRRALISDDEERIAKGASMLRGAIDSLDLPGSARVHGDVSQKVPSIPSSELSDG